MKNETSEIEIGFEAMLMRSLHIDVDAARRHLAALDDLRKPHIFVCVPEAPHADGGVRHIYGTLDAMLGRLEIEQHAGCGVFVTVNAMRGRRRLKTDVARVRALWIERDGPGRDLPLTPSLVVETSPGRKHEYLLIAGDAALESTEATRINRDIARTFCGDRQAIDLARALRLAGSWHLKAEPCRVRLRDAPIVRYPGQALRAAFPDRRQRATSHHRSRPARCTDRYLAAAVTGLCTELAHAAKGTRNATLNRAAFRLGRLGLGLNEISAALTPVAISIGLSEAETAATIRSGARAGGQQSVTPARRAS